MGFQSSSSPSSSSSPISIGWPSPSTPMDSYPTRNASSSSCGMACAFPSWPKGPSLGFHSSSPFHSFAPSAFISDADLFPDELLDGAACGPFLNEAPAPPRDVQLPNVMPLRPLYAQEKPKKQTRRRSSNKKRRPSKPMTPISESPEAPE
ncbi:hypothetical protein EJ08DRAFT_322858 [Tothia fuscella]|uniref:Uncharacterized protein n=1 Tax=Tothia fuscella TaxID=1048955 RepID=A0A9P4NNJ5_9PEZI|nr:hypothetical protein EJ08DRAFT_322858 [Tothia fuscella]